MRKNILRGLIIFSAVLAWLFVIERAELHGFSKVILSPLNG